jgi:hypothetical protein
MFTQVSMSLSNARSVRCKFKKMSVLKGLLEMSLEGKLMKISEICQFLALVHVYSNISQIKNCNPLLHGRKLWLPEKTLFSPHGRYLLIAPTVSLRSNIISAVVIYLNTRLTSKNLGMLMATAKATQGREYN